MLLDQHQQIFLLFLNYNNHLRNVINVIYHAAVPSQLCRKVTVGEIQGLVVAKTLSVGQCLQRALHWSVELPNNVATSLNIPK